METRAARPPQARAPPAPARSAQEKVLLVIVDNSNIWINGKQVAHATSGVKGGNAVEDPHWRVDLGGLVRKIQAAYADARLVTVLLVGSEPPSVDSVWSMFRASDSRVVVRTHERSAYTGREKRVDSDILVRLQDYATRVDRLQTMQAAARHLADQECAPALRHQLNTLAANDLTALGFDAAAGLPTRRVSELVQVVVCSGDADFLPLWENPHMFETFATEPGTRNAAEPVVVLPFVAIWSWRQSLSQAWQRLPGTAQPTVVYLDSFLDEIGFSKSWENLHSDNLPASRTLVVHDTDSHDAGVVLRALASLSVGHTQVYDAGRQHGVLIVLEPWFSARPDQVTRACVALQNELVREESSAVAHTLPFWLAANRTSGLGAHADIRVHNVYAPLADALDDADDEQAQPRQDKTRDADEDESTAFRTVKRHRPDRRRKRRRVYCMYRFHCTSRGDCNYAHRQEEIDTFRRKRAIAPAHKQKPCNGKCGHVNGVTCRYSHGSHDFYCTWCDCLGDHTVLTCERYAREKYCANG